MARIPPALQSGTDMRRTAPPAQSRLKWEAIAHQLSAKIQDGTYPDGSLLPPERLLSREFRVSRPTLRKALQSLVKAGLLVNVPGVGSRVCLAPQSAPAQPLASRIIALALPDIGNRFFIEVAEAIEYALLHRGYLLLLSNFRHDPAMEEWQVSEFTRRQVDGVILAHDATEPFPHGLELLRKRGIPFVMLFSSSCDSAFDSVVVDERAGVEQVLRYLFSLGHRRIAFCRPLLGEQPHPREVAFRELMAAHRLPIPEHFLLPLEQLSEDNGAHALKRLLETRPRATAIFAGNDRVALLVLKHLAALGVRVPEEISLVGFDNLRFTEHLSPPLTTVDQPKAEMGRRAVEMLLERVERRLSGPARREVFQPHLVVRQSCRVAPTDGAA